MFLDDSNHANEAAKAVSHVPVKLLVSIATVPALAVIIGLQAMLQQAQTLASNSEEIFRGDRLPLLPFPEPSTAPSPEILS